MEFYDALVFAILELCGVPKCFFLPAPTAIRNRYRISCDWVRYFIAWPKCVCIWPAHVYLPPEAIVFVKGVVERNSSVVALLFVELLNFFFGFDEGVFSLFELLDHFVNIFEAIFTHHELVRDGGILGVYQDEVMNVANSFVILWNPFIPRYALNEVLLAKNLIAKFFEI
ncbi:hypothetical protein GALL_492390 [mine drainage metagenome]|uniref:Uncharacterized protein n=1 Tax=mine drainage metagenome TaxID=410659 RepID=A0A1J5PD60_9ZZZZ